VPKQVFEIPGLAMAELGFETGIAKLDLAVEVFETDEFIWQFEYNTDLFDQLTIQRMLGHFRNLVSGMIKNPDLPLARIPLMSVEERRQILTEWNRTDRCYPQACIHELFESQVERSPDAIAVVFEDSQLCYRELNERANQLAWYLRQQGVGRDVPVGICVDRGLEMVVGLLGILKAGGAYVPLDPRLPQGRLSFMLSDVNPPVVLTQQRWQDKFPGARKVLVDTDREWIARESTANLGRGADPHTLAYVMYTSGSTGRPKAVPIEHRGVVNFLCSMQREPGLSREDVLLAVTTLSFDIAGLEIYLPLISGARLVVAGLETAVDGTRLLALLLESQATILQATPVTWRLLIEAGWQGSGDFKILCGGEALPPELAVELVKRSGSVWNMYGPTETTIWSSLRRVTGQEENGIPIGRPIANTQIYILDSHLNPVPANIAGEIYIGGDGVARGYLNRAELTAERFVANPLAPSQPARLYKTGDLGRFRANGDIECLGRVDAQVKLRGMRIELGEIEAVLASHPGIRGAVVTLHGENEQRKLSAYVVAAKEAAPTADEVRRFLRSKLPEHMVPASYWRLDKLPLLSSGKIDRKALSPGVAAPLEVGQELVPPRNEAESKLADIWRELLAVEEVGIGQNFFELGGHSLLVLQMIDRIRRIFELELPVRSVFDEPTIEGLADELQKAQALGLKARVPIVQRRDGSAVTSASREALLSQLSTLSADDAQNLIRRALNSKHSA
jgi:amino acid adenylation domain-containing protein